MHRFTFPIAAVTALVGLLAWIWATNLSGPAEPSGRFLGILYLLVIIFSPIFLYLAWRSPRATNLGTQKTAQPRRLMR